MAVNFQLRPNLPAGHCIVKVVCRPTTREFADSVVQQQEKVQIVCRPTEAALKLLFFIVGLEDVIRYISLKDVKCPRPVEALNIVSYII